jgi:flagellar protein FlaG
MVSGVSQINSAAASAAQLRAAPQESAAGASAAKPVAIPPKPVLSLPKPADIKFDAAEVRQSLKEAVRLLNDQINSKKLGLGFQLDDSVEVPVVTVRNTQTGEVIRQLPNETALKLAHSIDNAKGMFVNKQF